MAFRVLSTKLYNPPIKPGLVKRARLVQRLETGYRAGKSVTLVSAPAGFGKTTLVSEWIAGTDTRKSFGWVSLDDGDNDPVRFLTYVVTAIQKVNGDIGKSVLAILQSSQISNLADLVEALINDISTMSKPFLIVLDDFHQIKNIEVHKLMQLFLTRRPELMHWVIITREDPFLPLPRMRVQGQITEVREQDLRFTLPEAQEFLVEAMGITLTNEEVSKLRDRTEGWAAGMQLAALALDEYSNVEKRKTFIDAFAGSNRLITDYLISEVLQHQPEMIQRFLLSTSILDRFCAELCDHVVFDGADAGGSQVILESIEKENMFLVPLDDQRHWYRYHHLFGEMLNHSLRRSAPDRMIEMHRRASEWFETKGYVSEAIQHAMTYATLTGDWELTRTLLDRYALRLVFQGQGSQALSWFQALPKTFLASAPEICIYYAWALVLTFRTDYLDAVEEKLQMAERAIQLPDLPDHAYIGEDGTLVPLRDWVTGQACAIRSQVVMGRFQVYVDPQELITLSLRGLELLSDTEKIARSTCQINFAYAQLMQNDHQEAKKAFEKALPF